MDLQKLALVCQVPVGTAKEAKAFFRALWFDLGIDFQPDDDFTMLEEIDPEYGAMLNQQLDKIFDTFGNSTYDMHLDVITHP